MKTHPRNSQESHPNFYYPGLTFSSAWRNGDATLSRYNGYGYPPHSGTMQLWTGLANNSGTIWFDEPVLSVEAWFSAGQGVTMEAYDSYGNLLKQGSLGRVYGDNKLLRLTVSSGSEPISYVIVHDSTDYWTMDDFAYGW